MIAACRNLEDDLVFRARLLVVLRQPLAQTLDLHAHARIQPGVKIACLAKNLLGYLLLFAGDVWMFKPLLGEELQQPAQGFAIAKQVAAVHFFNIEQLIRSFCDIPHHKEQEQYTTRDEPNPRLCRWPGGVGRWSYNGSQNCGNSGELGLR